jgi:hypothetical protein
MKIIKFFCDYANSDVIAVEYIRQNELFFDEKFNIDYRITISDDYTHAVIINKAMPELKIPKENVIGIAHEPPKFLNLIPGENEDREFINYVTKYVGKYYIGEKYDLPNVFIEGNGYVGHTSIPRMTINKNKIMSLMISQKIFAHGHVYRHQLADVIIKHKLPIDIYGRGCKLHEPNELLKGEFSENEYIENYLFHISIENTIHPHYFTEKIVNPLLYGTNVIYLGCSNIHNYFSENGIYLLNGNIEHDINLIFNIFNNWQQYYKFIDTKKVKEVISIKNIIDELK